MSIVDTLELGAERQEWRRAIETLRSKPLLQRSDLEMSRVLTLISRFKVFQVLSFDTRLAVCRALTFERVAQKGAEVVGPQELKSYQGPWRLVLSGSVEMRVASGQGRARHDVVRGESLGDSLTLRSLPSGSAYVTKEPCDFLCLRHDEYERLLGHLEEKELDARVQFFSKSLIVPIFASWGPYQMRELAKRAYPRKYSSRTVVVREREEGQDLFFIRSGECRVVREIEFSEHGKQGHPARRTIKLLELALLTQGEYFGELALYGINVDTNARHRAEPPPRRRGGGGAVPGAKRAPARRTVGGPTPPAGRGSGNRPGAWRHRGTVMRQPPAADESPLALLSGAAGSPDDGDEGDSDDGDDLNTADVEIGDAARGAGSNSGLRQATVFSHTPLELLVVPAQAARDLITGNPLQRILQYAKGYPTAQEVRSQFMAQHDWASFKQNLVADIISVDRGRT